MRLLIFFIVVMAPIMIASLFMGPMYTRAFGIGCAIAAAIIGWIWFALWVSNKF